MIFNFDYNGQYEYPMLVLGNPDKTELFIMEQATAIKFTPRFNTVSDLEFTVYQYYGEVELPYYDDIRKNKLVKMIGTGWFLVDSVEEEHDGGVPYKTVKCVSYEYTINYKGINILDGTYKFYDLFQPQGTLLYEVTQVLFGWNIGHVDVELLNKYRTFDIPETTLYGFLMNEVSRTYECIFMFDIENMLINVYAPENLVKETGIILTFDNVNKHIKVSELSTDIYTVLRVNGADNLSIDRVNPLGTNKIYNFSYYMNEKWMDDTALIAKINNWNILIEQYRPQYITNLNSMKQKNKELIKLKAQLVDLQNELAALEIVRKNVVSDPPQLALLTSQVDAKNIQITNKQGEITAKQNELTAVQTALNNINKTIGFDNYFTNAEKIKLDPYIIESIYTDENFIVTDEMTVDFDANSDAYVMTTTGTKKIKDLTDTDIIIDDQYIANQLYEQGQSMLNRVSQPSFQFSLDALNFLFSEKFLPFIKDIELGALVNIEIKEGDWARPVLLEMQIDYDNPTSFSMTFGNRFRLSDDAWTFGDLFNEHTKVSSQVGSTLALAAEPVLNGSISEMTEKLNSNFIAANQQIQSTADNEFTIGGFGFRGRKKDTRYTSGYDPHQIWLSNEMLVMTDDEWKTSKLAIGHINGYYSVNAEIIAGNLIAGNQLIIQDGIKGQESTFIVDANGARLTNASFTLTTKDGKGRIVLNPSSGIRIQTNKTGTMKDVFYVDSNGYLMATDITATGGTIGGFNITTNRFYSSTQSSGSPVIDLNTNGTGRISLLSWTPTTATFKGRIEATEGKIGGFNIGATSLYSDRTDTNGPVINLNTDGTGRISGFTWTPTASTFSGRIEAGSGLIGGFNINASSIYSTASDGSGSIIRLSSNGSGRLGGMSWTTTSTSFNGSITASSGRIGNWTINDDGLYNSNGNYIYINSGRLGLLSWSGSTAYFNGNIYARNLDNNGITEIKMGNNSVINRIIANSAVSESKLDNLCVSTAKIKDAAITNAKIANLAVKNANIDNATITGAKIVNATITAAQIGNAAIETAKIKDGAITNAKIDNLNASKITAGTISTARLNVDDITAKVISTGRLVAEDGTFKGTVSWNNGNGRLTGDSSGGVVMYGSSTNRITAGNQLIITAPRVTINSNDRTILQGRFELRGEFWTSTGSGSLLKGFTGSVNFATVSVLKFVNGIAYV